MRTLEEVRLGLLRYIDTEILPKLPPEARGSFGVRAVVSYLNLRGDRLLLKFAGKSVAQMAEIVTPEGVDVDFLRDWAKQLIPPEGYPISIPMNPFKAPAETLELVLKPTEIDLIHEYLTGVK